MSQEPLINRGDFLPLAPPKMWTRGFLFICGIVTLLLLMFVREMSLLMEAEFSQITWLVPLITVTVLMAIRRLLLPSRPRKIRFFEDHVEIPRGRNSRRSHTTKYDEIRTIVPLSSRGQPALVIDSPGRVHVLVAADFAHPELWRVLWAQLMERIRRRPGSIEQLHAMRDLANLSQQTSSTSPTFTKRLFWVIAAIFGAQYFLSPPVDILEYLYFGANSSVLVLESGQWWRVVTANLLHGNLLHIGVNGFALYFLGTYSERLLGVPRTVVLILGSGLFGAAASMIGTPLFSVGISTAIFGLLGSYLAVHLRFGKELPPPYRQSRLWWTVILVLNGLLSIGVPVIDGWGHFGGFVAGLALTLVMLRGQESFIPRPPHGSITNLFAALLVALYAGASVFAVGYALGDHPEDEVRIAQELLERSDEENPLMLLEMVRQWDLYQPQEERSPELSEILRRLESKARDRL